MTTTERTEFLRSRTEGVGGSDIGSMLSNQIEVEYGCERNLWARLSGIPDDNPGSEKELLMLGHVCEPFVRRAYSDITGRRVDVAGLTKHPTVARLQYHDDGIISPLPEDPRQTKGLIEVKSIGRQMMYKVQESGLPSDYVFQLEGGLACHGLDHGTFAVAVREDLLPLVAIELTARMAGEPIPVLPRQPKIVHFEIERKPEIIRLIEEYVPYFWDTVGNEMKAPARYEPETPRCQRCPRQNWCHGKALMDSVQPELSVPRRNDLEPIIQEYRNAVALVEQAEELKTEAENKFKVLLGKQTAIQVPVTAEKDGKIKTEWKNILWRLRKGAERVDGKAMAPQYDALRRAAIAAGVAGAELVPPSGKFITQGMPSRPLLLASVLPKKDKKKGEVPEQDEESFGEE